MKARELALVAGLLGPGLVTQLPLGCGTGGNPEGGIGGAGGDTAASNSASVGTSTSASTASGSTTNTSTAASGSTTTASSAGGSGSSSSTAAASTSASTGAGGGVVISPGNMIDDMESGSGSILMQGGRIGAWYTYNDMTPAGVQVPPQGSPFAPEIIPGGNGSSTRAAHTYGSGFTMWGAGMGFDLNHDGVTKNVYAVTGFTGLAFWAKGSPAIRAKVLVASTVPTADGGLCTTGCGDNHGMIVNLTSTWVQYVVPFASLTQEGWGTAAPLDLTRVLSVQFQVAAGMNFDFWIDDIGLY